MRQTRTVGTAGFDRRHFLKSASAAVGAAALIGWPVVRGQTARKEVMIGGRRARVGDIHAHCVFAQLAEVIAGTNLDGVTFPDFVALGPDRLVAMDERGIDVQALSVNAFWWYEGESALASEIVGF